MCTVGRFMGEQFAESPLSKNILAQQPAGRGEGPRVQGLGTGLSFQVTPEDPSWLCRLKFIPFGGHCSRKDMSEMDET
ncbi:hypothetical protein DPMN_073911 [Dreissena polymorpha]|uniref:Uncharacterized protein n=1 Tax=Dreissena polymorpha TaxID=45954 RepID=A0A9D3YGP0_DREPO|nr:hypothetical protein DPMN_073911 [Dreissena polymorpha]